MTGLTYAHPVHLHRMMARLGIEPDAGISSQLCLEYAAARRQCVTCRAKKACTDWLNYAPEGVNFAPFFCVNDDTLLRWQHNQPGPRWVR